MLPWSDANPQKKNLGSTERRDLDVTAQTTVRGAVKGRENSDSALGFGARDDYVTVTRGCTWNQRDGEKRARGGR